MSFSRVALVVPTQPLQPQAPRRVLTVVRVIERHDPGVEIQFPDVIANVPGRARDHATGVDGLCTFGVGFHVSHAVRVFQ